MMFYGSNVNVCPYKHLMEPHNALCRLSDTIYILLKKWSVLHYLQKWQCTSFETEFTHPSWSVHEEIFIFGVNYPFKGSENKHLWKNATIFSIMLSILLISSYMSLIYYDTWVLNEISNHEIFILDYTFIYNVFWVVTGRASNLSRRCNHQLLCPS